MNRPAGSTRTETAGGAAVVRSAGVAWFLVAAAAAVVWATSLAMWQPLAEPARPWHDVWAENNMYWARDLRYVAIAAALAGLVRAFEGSPASVRYAALGGIGWIGLDVLLDRFDLEGAPVAVVLSVLACAVLAFAVLAGRRRWLPGPAKPHVLAGTAGLTAALVPLVWTIESADDVAMTAPGVVAARVVVGVLLAGTSVACALAAAPPAGAAPRGNGRVAAAVLLTVVVSAGGYLLSRPESGIVAIGGLTFVLLVGLAALIHSRRPRGALDWLGYLAVTASAVAGAVALVVALGALTLFVVPAGRLLTWLAANPAVNDADTDVVMVVVGLVAGAVFGWLLNQAVRYEEVSRSSR